MQRLKLLGCMLIMVLLAACAAPTDPSEIYKSESGDQIFKRGVDALRQQHYKEAISRFEALDVQYPFSHDAERAELYVIYAHFMNDDYPTAESAAERYIHSWPANPHVAYAYYLRALAYYHQNLGIFERVFQVDISQRDLASIKKAWLDFAVVAHQFADSEYAPAASQYMIYLRNLMAEHELRVGEYYFNHYAYVASANRASWVIRSYQGAPAVKSALALLAKSYNALHLNSREKEVLQVIKYNYGKLS